MSDLTVFLGPSEAFLLSLAIGEARKYHDFLAALNLNPVHRDICDDMYASLPVFYETLVKRLGPFVPQSQYFADDLYLAEGQDIAWVEVSDELSVGASLSRPWTVYHCKRPVRRTILVDSATYKDLFYRLKRAGRQDILDDVQCVITVNTRRFSTIEGANRFLEEWLASCGHGQREYRIYCSMLTLFREQLASRDNAFDFLANASGLDLLANASGPAPGSENEKLEEWTKKLTDRNGENVLRLAYEISTEAIEIIGPGFTEPPSEWDDNSKRELYRLSQTSRDVHSTTLRSRETKFLLNNLLYLIASFVKLPYEHAVLLEIAASEELSSDWSRVHSLFDSGKILEEVPVQESDNWRHIEAKLAPSLSEYEAEVSAGWSAGELIASLELDMREFGDGDIKRTATQLWERLEDWENWRPEDSTEDRFPQLAPRWEQLFREKMARVEGLINTGLPEKARLAVKELPKDRPGLKDQETPHLRLSLCRHTQGVIGKLLEHPIVRSSTQVRTLLEKSEQNDLPDVGVIEFGWRPLREYRDVEQLGNWHDTSLLKDVLSMLRQSGVVSEDFLARPFESWQLLELVTRLDEVSRREGDSATRELACFLRELAGQLNGTAQYSDCSPRGSWGDATLCRSRLDARETLVKTAIAILIGDMAERDRAFSEEDARKVVPRNLTPFVIDDVGQLRDRLSATRKLLALGPSTRGGDEALVVTGLATSLEPIMKSAFSDRFPVRNGKIPATLIALTRDPSGERRLLAATLLHLWQTYRNAAAHEGTERRYSHWEARAVFSLYELAVELHDRIVEGQNFIK